MPSQKPGAPQSDPIASTQLPQKDAEATARATHPVSHDLAPASPQGQPAPSKPAQTGPKKQVQKKQAQPKKTPPAPPKAASSSQPAKPQPAKRQSAKPRSAPRPSPPPSPQQPAESQPDAFDPLNSSGLEGFAPLPSFAETQQALSDLALSPLPAFEEQEPEPAQPQRNTLGQMKGKTQRQPLDTSPGYDLTTQQPRVASGQLVAPDGAPLKPSHQGDSRKNGRRNKAGKVANQRAKDVLRKSFWQHFPEQVKGFGARAIAPVLLPVKGAIAAAASKLSVDQQRRVANLWDVTSPVLLTTLIVTGGLVTLRQIGIFQSAELRAYDFMIRQRPSPGIDERLLLVAVTELDLRRLAADPLPDGIYASVLAQLQRHEPRVIGLDIYRDFSYPPGTQELYEQFKQPNVIGIEKKPNLLDPVGVAPPPLAEAQIGFNDVSIDPDTALRRGLLLTFEYSEEGDSMEVQSSFSYRMAELYLREEGIEAQNIPGSDFGIALGEARIEPLTRNSGGYQNLDDGGYQVLLNYRAAFAEQVATTISVSDVLDGKLKPEQVKDKIVVIGTTAPSNKDFFYTPFTKARKGGLDMPGVVTHAQFTSQLVDAALGDRPLLVFWPEWLELTWLVGCVALGAILTTWLRHPLKLLLAQIGGICILSAIHWLLFLQYTWVPMVLPVVGVLASSIATVAYNNYRMEQEQKLLAQRAEEQEQAILMLRMATRQKTRSNTEIQTPTPIQTEGLLADRYKIKKVLASGGFGVTYVAQDMQRPGVPECVVKQLRPTIQDPQFLKVARRLFKTEADILEIVGRHDRIPQLLAYFDDGKDFYLVEDLIEGTPLGDRLPQDRRLSDKVVFKMLRELLPTLAFIHERHIIHRDIKPNNIIHRPADDALVLIDFGAVKQIQPNVKELEADKTIAIGTQGYAAPEQLAGHPRINSDIYALGVIAIRALTGVPPHMMEQDPKTGDLSWFQYARCNRGLAKVVHRMTRYHFAERYSTADEALRDLLALL